MKIDRRIIKWRTSEKQNADMENNFNSISLNAEKKRKPKGDMMSEKT